jgi:phage protein D/phage baseplate assembly protein gpV
VTALEALPNFTVELDGLELDTTVAASLAEVRVLQQLSLPALCELHLVELRDSLGSFAAGTPLRVRIAGTDQPLFAGEITAVRHSYGPGGQREVRLRAYDPLHRLRKRQPVRAHVELDLRDLARELVADVGLSVQMEDAGPVWPRLVQWRQSDLELLAEVAARCGLYFTVRGDTLHFATLAGTGDEVELELGRTLLEADFDASTEPACRSVDVRAWDSWTAAEHEAIADVPRVGRSIELDQAPGDVGSPGRRTLVDEAAHSAAHAGVLAQAELDRRVAGEVTVQGVAEGDSRVQPGCAVQLRGVAAPLVGRYIVTSVTHTIDRRSGFRSRFDTSPPLVPARARACVTTLGIVLDADDPQKIGRVRVSLPNYCGVETDWLEVVSPGGGRGKGLITVPDTGDRVLLLLPREDPAQAVVLGGLYASDGPPDTGVRDRRVLRYTFVTRGGQRLYLEEEEKTVRVENGTGSFMEISPGRAQIANGEGSYVELTPKSVRLHANADLEIDAPGKALTFLSASVDFRTG